MSPGPTFPPQPPGKALDLESRQRSPGRRERAGGARFYVAAQQTGTAPHVRASLDTRYVFRNFLLALAPCALFGAYNVGLQAHRALATTEIAATEIATTAGWRGALLAKAGLGLDSGSVLACLAQGFLYLVPLLLVAFVSGALWERLFALGHGRPVLPGLGSMSLLFALAVPPTLPLWQAALGMSFGVVFGKEVFGGTGMHVFHPVVVGLVFLLHAYPADMTGTEGLPTSAGGSPLQWIAAGGTEALPEHGLTWTQGFLGLVPGNMGDGSTLACLMGAAWLLVARVASWRVMAGVLLGLTATAWLGNAGLGAVAIPVHWHLVLGSVAFGAVFFATDPSSAASTNPGRWAYGLLIGFLVILMRVASPQHSDGTLAALLLAGAFAPLIDHAVVRTHALRRARTARTAGGPP